MTYSTPSFDVARCPVFPGKATVMHVSFDDPPRLVANVKAAEERLAPYRRVRDEIRAFVETLPDTLTHSEDKYTEL
jgi:arsenate reductase (thioredoxin)